MSPMRIAGLLALALFFPPFAHAADPPALTAYTISHDTIYPSAAAGSGLATTTSIDIAFSEPVKVSMKVISVGGAVVKSLYSSSSVTNPAPKTWDGRNTAGTLIDDGTYTVLISATSTATSVPMTDSSRTVTVASSDAPASPDGSSDASDTTTPSTSGGGPTEYLPIPVLHIVTAEDRTVSSGAESAFTAAVYDGKGNKRNDAVVAWSFGDGMRRAGASVFHTYYGPGEYLAVVRATTPDGGEALAEVVVTVKDANIKIASVSSRGIGLTNNGTRTLDLSFWRLSMGGQEFKIPEHTQLLAGRTTLFPSQVIELPVADSARLLYPSGEVAAVYPAAAVAPAGGGPASGGQPSVGTASYQKVSEVEPILSARTNAPVHDEAVSAPAAATELAAVGAALPTASSSRASSIFKSPWTLGLLGVIALAAGAFVLL